MLFFNISCEIKVLYFSQFFDTITKLHKAGIPEVFIFKLWFFANSFQAFKIFFPLSVIIFQDSVLSKVHQKGLLGSLMGYQALLPL